MDETLVKAGKPCCPNHGEPLEGLPFPLTKKGTGMCPVSGCHFDYVMELDETDMVKNKFGVMEKKKKWNVTGDENA